jgi:hypothetical protein
VVVVSVLEQPPLPNRRPGRGGRAQPLEEVAGLDPERPGDGEQQPDPDPERAGLVLVHPRRGDPDPQGQLLLG